MAQKNIKFNTATSTKQTSAIPKSTTTKSYEQSMANSTSSDHPQKMIDDCIIIWVDPNLDISNEENQELISQLRSIVNTIKTFTNINQCVQFLEQIKNEKVFLIISDCFAKQIASLEEQFIQLNSIYIFCDRESKYKEIIKAYKKGKGVFTQMKLLCNDLKKEVQQLNNDLISISIIPASSAANNLNELDPLFMYFQLLKENLFTIDYNQETEIKKFIKYYRQQYSTNEREMRTIERFERIYSQKSPIYWYTLESFIYRTLNAALRTVDVGSLIKMRFFIRDLHQEIKQRHSQLRSDQIPSKVYRGQGLLNEDFEKLKKAPGGLLSFNSFISTSVKEYIAKEFFPSLLHDGGKKAILFEINIDPSVSSVSFTPVRDVSAIPGEEEILFSMSTVFRITKIEEIEGCIWRVNLSFTNEKDPLLKRLTDHMRISLGSGNGWRRLGQLMIKMGQFDSALETFKVLLKEVDPDDKAENAFLHNQLGYILKQKDQLEEAFSHYQESLQINLTYMSDIDPRLSSTYSNIGGILKKLGDTNGALKFYELVLKIDLAAPEPNPLEIAIDHNNIGSVLDDQGKYPEALNSYEQALQIKLAHLPPHHPSLASTYSNIGLIHQKMGDCSTALTFYQQTFQIQQKSLPPNHPSLIVTHGKLARTLEDLHRYEEAIKHAQQAVNVARLAFGASHPEVEKRQKYFNELQEKFGFH